MRFRNLFGALGFAATIATPPFLVAQSTAREAAGQFLQAWDARRWTEAARLLDLDQFDQFRQDFIKRAGRSASEGPRITVEDLKRRNPGMPDDVAEYQVKMIEEQRRRFADPTPYEFARVSSASALRALSPAESAARWLESRDPAYQLRMQFEQAGCAPPEDADQVPQPKRRLIGVVSDADSVTYALFQEQRPGAEADTRWAGGDLNVMELREQGGRWVVVPRGDLLPEVGQVDVSGCRRSD